MVRGRACLPLPLTAANHNHRRSTSTTPSTQRTPQRQLTKQPSRFTGDGFAAQRGVRHPIVRLIEQHMPYASCFATRTQRMQRSLCWYSQHHQVPSLIRLCKVLARREASVPHLHNLVGQRKIAAHHGIGAPSATLEVNIVHRFMTSFHFGHGITRKHTEMIHV